MRIASEQAVDKLLFFSSKAWRGRPPTIERSRGLKPRLGETNFEVGHYDLDGRSVVAVGLRHPEYARREVMVKAVKLSLAIPLDHATPHPSD